MSREGRKPQLQDFGDLFMPDEAAEPILARPVRAALLEWLTEIWAEPDLKAVGIKPRKRAIFDGPPGVGKTTLGHHLAARLGLPMLAVRPDNIIDKWVGSTGQNIGALFECARRGLANPRVGPDAVMPVVLFMDEFEALAATRRAADTGADQHRNEAVDTLLQRLEQHDGFVIAATNFGDRIDPAMWRRFDIHLTLELPGQEERERIFERYIAPFGLPGAALTAMAEALETASPALIRALCENVKRQIVLGPKLKLDMGKGAVIERIIASTHPHPELGKPRLWSLGAKDHAMSLMPWPLPMADDVAEGAAAGPPADAANIVPFGGRG
ncbi:MAG: ATP-binding protein [Caulobacteraceae bacterium]|nr:ATP-binding protein [Caulobacteraceae bacterium]